MVDPNKIITEISDLETARKLLPIWTDWGIEDYGVLIHSLGGNLSNSSRRSLRFC